MKRAVAVAVCTLLIIAVGLGALHWGCQALLDRAFAPIRYESLTPELLNEIYEYTGVSIPEEAVFDKGEKYSWLDVTMKIIFSVPIGSENEPELLCRQMVDFTRWEADNAPISDTEAAYLGQDFSGKLCGTLGEDSRAALFFTNPQDGYIHVLLVYFGP